MVKLVILVAAAGLVVAAPALATEGPPPTAPSAPPAAPPLPNTLQPVSIPKQPPAGPRVLAAQVTPNRIRAGQRSRLRLALSNATKVRVVVFRMKGRKAHRVSGRTLSTPLGARILRLPAHLRAGRYRVTTIALDDQGNRSRAVRRMLVVRAR